jgi:glycosyltransferase involved in cell wall biosynthesis
MRVDIVDPSRFTPPYDHALCAALARAGAEVSLVTSEFAYGSVPAPVGYHVRTPFYRHAIGVAGSRARTASKLAQHVPDMVRYRSGAADIVHFQWLTVPQLDVLLLPRRRTVVITAHDLLPREPKPGQVRAQRRLYDRVDAVIVHSEYGRAQLLEGTSVDTDKVHIVHHGAFDHLARGASLPLPPELAAVSSPVVLFFGLLRPYKGVDVLLDAWRSVRGAELWVVGRARMETAALRRAAGPSVRFVERFVSDAELPAYFRRADVVVLPYRRTERFDQSGVLFTALAFGKAVVLTDIGGFGEVAAAGAARMVAPDDPEALAAALTSLLDDQQARSALERAASAAASGAYSWDEAARRTLHLYEAAESRR